MALTLLALALLSAMASPALTARHRTVCVDVAIEGSSSLVCVRPDRRR